MVKRNFNKNNKNKFLFNLRDYLEDKRFNKNIYWISDKSFIIKDLSELTQEGSPFKSIEIFKRNILEYEFTKEKDGEKLKFTHDEFKKGMTEEQIRLIKKRKKKKSEGFLKTLKEKLISKLNEEKKFLEIEKEIEESKNFEKKVISDKLKNFFLLRRKNNTKEILTKLKNKIDRKNMTKKEENNQSNNEENESNSELANNYFKKIQCSGIMTNVCNFEKFRGTGFGKSMDIYSNSINNETVENTF